MTNTSNGKPRRRPPYPTEVRERAIRMVRESEAEHGSQWKAVNWLRRPSVPSPKRSVARVRRCGTGCAKPNAIAVSGPEPRRTSASGSRHSNARSGNCGRRTNRRSAERDLAEGQRVFCPGGARPPVQAMIAFLDDHRDVYGVEPICRVLPIAPSTYYEHVARQRDPDRRPARERRDEVMREHVRRVFDANFGVYGVRKVWRQLNREGIAVARCTVARLMKSMRPHGAVRGKRVRTTVPDPAAPCPLDRVNRQFQAPCPNALWVSEP